MEISVIFKQREKVSYSKKNPIEEKFGTLKETRFTEKKRKN